MQYKRPQQHDRQLMTDNAPNPGYLGEDLIFIISQPRSGSTLLQRMLSGHSWIQTSAETWLMLAPAHGLNTRGVSTEYNAHWASRAVREFLDQYASGEETYREGVRAFAKTIYGEVLRKNDKKRFLDKTPRYHLIVNELKALFPRARFIILLRNPLSVLASELDTYVKGDWPMLARFRTDLIDAPERLLDAVDQLGEAGILVRYEDMVRDPEQNLRGICDHLGLPWENGLTDYSETPAPKGRANDTVGVHRHTSPSQESVGKWKTLGEDRQTRHFALAYLEELGDETIARLGYDADQLRSALDTASGDKLGGLFLWQQAIRPSSEWSTREKIGAAYYFGARDAGSSRGMIESTKVLVHHILNGIRSLFVKPRPIGSDRRHKGSIRPGAIDVGKKAS